MRPNAQEGQLCEKINGLRGKLLLQYHQAYSLTTSGEAVDDSEDSAIDVVVDVEKLTGSSVTEQWGQRHSGVAGHKECFIT